MGKYSLKDYLIQSAKIALGYFIVLPVIFGLLCSGLFSLLGYFSLKESTQLYITLIIQIILTFLPAIIQSVIDGYHDSFWGRYSLKLHFWIPLAAMIIYIAVDQIPNVNICPIWNIFLKFRWSIDLFSILYFVLMFVSLSLFYFIGRRFALYENAEAVYKADRAVAEEEKQKKLKDLPYTPQPEQRKTATWRDSISGDE